MLRRRERGATLVLAVIGMLESVAIAKSIAQGVIRMEV